MPRDADGLTLRQRAFVDRLTDPTSPTFCKPSASYRAIAPYILPQSARLGAMRMSTDANVQAAIVGQLNMRQLGSKLKTCLRLSKRLMEHDDPSIQLSATREARSTVMDYAALTGQLVHRSEVTQLSDADRLVIASVVRETMATGSMPSSLPPSVSEAERSASRPVTENVSHSPATEPASSEKGMTPTPPPAK